jgi:RimJ/RimL family protein N-acetyltransferase
MATIPMLYTPRLVLRPFVASDAPRVRELAGDHRVAAFTLRIPHPYPEGAAEAFIASHAAAADKGNYHFAITLAGTRTPGREFDLGDTGHLVGTVALTTVGNPEDASAELGYWIGVPYWNKGFATEAARALLAFGFRARGFHRIAAMHFAENTASGRVMQKLGMLREGVLRHAAYKEDQWRDLVVYSLLENEWNAQNRRSLRTTRTPAVEAHVAGV